MRCVYMALHHKDELINEMCLYGYLSRPGGDKHIVMAKLYIPYNQIKRHCFF